MGEDRHSAFRRAVEGPDGPIDLGRAALAVAADEYPDLRPEIYLARLDALASRARDLSSGETGPYRLIAAINYVLFTREGFRGNREDYYDPRNSFLNDVIERRRGIPITLSVLYMEVARRAGLELSGVGFPGHFLIKYAGPEEEADRIIIDAYDQGEVLGVEELQAILDGLYGAGKVAFRPEFLAPVAHRQIVERMLNNLKSIYLRKENFSRALSVSERLAILDPASAPEVRDRGLLYLKLDRFEEATRDLEKYLELLPGAEDAAEIREQLAELKKGALRLN